MATFIIRRVLSSFPALFGILFVTFSIGRLLPGDPCRAILGEKATDLVCDDFIHRHGLDRPIMVQFGIYIKEIASGDLGTSIRFNKSVTNILIERLPTTFELSLAAMAFSVLLGIPMGIISAVKHNSSVDVGTMVIANVGVSMPVFWLGLMLAYIFALLLKDTPFQLPPSGRLSPGMIVPAFYEVWGWQVTETGMLHAFLEFISRLNLINSILIWRWDIFKDAVRHMILPAIAVGTIPLAIIARMTRSSMLDVLGQDYVRTARAKGLKRTSVVLRHALRNALLPLVTIIGLSLGAFLGGAVLTETIFGLSGVGRILFESITARDYVIVQSFTVVIAIFFVMLNLIVDISYVYLDPRVRLD
ncbi:MAG: peptide ABC transporter permease [Chloroflexi bacterium RBG_16_54_18]|nr:MAG: peptide ABC transporter permease [Chloroflexi bacterium RBG_16_54_18]